jgi:hypothetical protein
MKTQTQKVVPSHSPSPMGSALATSPAMRQIENSPFVSVQRKKIAGAFGQASQLKEEKHVRQNKTGIPDQVKAGVESLSGISLDSVNVHYNSAKPAQMQALAYTQGNEIHVAPGQEKHVPHEAWHVVQQTQGRVQPTMHMTDGTAVNDDHSLESEADHMGAKAMQFAGKKKEEKRQLKNSSNVSQQIRQPKWHVKATCDVNGTEAQRDSTDRVPMNWLVKAMEPQMRVVSNPLFQCAEPKSLSAALSRLTRNQDEGASEDMLNNISWTEVTWWWRNDEDGDEPDGDIKTGDDADPCTTCRTWIDKDSLTIKGGALALALAKAEHTTEHERTEANREKHLQQKILAMKQKITDFLGLVPLVKNYAVDENIAFTKPFSIAKVEDVTAEEIEAILSDVDVYKEITGAETTIMDIFTKKLTEGRDLRSTKAVNVRKKGVADIVTEWNKAWALVVVTGELD